MSKNGERDMRRSLQASVCTLALSVACGGWAIPPACAQEAGPPVGDSAASDSAPKPAGDQIIVSGVRQSIESAIEDKRRASEI